MKNQIKSPEQERLDYCPKTITLKHLWHRAVIGEEYQYMNYTQDGNQKPYSNPIQATKCFACGVVNDSQA